MRKKKREKEKKKKRAVTLLIPTEHLIPIACQCPEEAIALQGLGLCPRSPLEASADPGIPTTAPLLQVRFRCPSVFISGNSEQQELPS